MSAIGVSSRTFSTSDLDGSGGGGRISVPVDDCTIVAAAALEFGGFGGYRVMAGVLKLLRQGATMKISKIEGIA